MPRALVLTAILRVSRSGFARVPLGSRTPRFGAIVLPALLGLFLLAAARDAFGSEDVSGTSIRGRNVLVVSGGLADVGIRDEFVTPVAYRARLPSLHLTYERWKSAGFHRVDCHYAGGSLESDRQPREVREHLAMISWSRQWALRTWPMHRTGSLDILAGGGASSTLSDTDFLDPEGFSMVDVIDESWYWSHSLDLAVVVAWRADSTRSGIVLEAGAPLLQLVSRPGYAHHLSRRNRAISENFLRAALGGRLAPVWREPAASLRARATRALGEHIGVEAAWRLAWWSASEPLPLRMLSSDYLAGIRWSF